MLRTRLTLAPGQNGTKKLARRFGQRLICVRYRYDDATKRRFKTVELVVDEIPWERSRRPDPPVRIRVGATKCASARPCGSRAAAGCRAKAMGIEHESTKAAT